MQRPQPRLEFLLPLSLKLEVNAQPPDAFYQKFWPALACSLALGCLSKGGECGLPAHSPPLIIPGARLLAPPHSTSARSYDNLHYHNYDLVAISMGTGGWVSQINFLFG